MSFSSTFKQIINHIKKQGVESKPRDLKVREVLLADFDIDPIKPIANFKSRAFNWRYLAGELAWYLHRDRDVEYISRFSSFWSNITNPNSNQINSNYGSLVINDSQMSWVIESLKKDINTRQAIMFFNRPEFQFEGNKDFVCTMYANFFVRNNELNMKIQMRSNDIFYGLTYDAPFFSFLQQSVWHILRETYPDLKLGYYYHYADNLHYYERHFDLADRIAAEEDDNVDLFVLKRPFIEYKQGSVSLSDAGREFCNRIDSTLGQNDVDYKMILKDYFKT
jgi:thymidylate synthase